MRLRVSKVSATQHHWHLPHMRLRVSKVSATQHHWHLPRIINNSCGAFADAKFAGQLMPVLNEQKNLTV